MYIFLWPSSTRLARHGFQISFSLFLMGNNSAGLCKELSSASSFFSHSAASCVYFYPSLAVQSCPAFSANSQAWNPEIHTSANEVPSASMVWCCLLSKKYKKQTLFESNYEMAFLERWQPPNVEFLAVQLSKHSSQGLIQNLAAPRGEAAVFCSDGPVRWNGKQDSWEKLVHTANESKHNICRLSVECCMNQKHGLMACSVRAQPTVVYLLSHSLAIPISAHRFSQLLSCLLQEREV